MKITPFLPKANNLYYGLGAAITMAMMDTTEASAQTSGGGTVGSISQYITTEIGSVGKLSVAASFLAGVAMVGMGLMKLKAAADSQGQQVRYGEGLWRLAVGAGLVAVPAVTGILTASAQFGGANITNYNGF